MSFVDGKCMIEVELHPLTCMACGVKYAIDKSYYENGLAEHKGGAELPDDATEDKQERGWYTCPNGHFNRRVQTTREIFQDRTVDLSRKLEAAEANAARLQAMVDVVVKGVNERHAKRYGSRRRGRKAATVDAK